MDIAANKKSHLPALLFMICSTGINLPLNMPGKLRALPVVFLFVCFCLSLTLPANGQDYKKMREELVQKQKNTRAEIVELNDQIDQFQERLNLAEQKYDRLHKQFEDLNRVIALQEEKISKLKQEQQQIQEEIALVEQEIDQNEQKLERLTEDYKKTLSYIYKHGRTTHLALIFSSNSINQMLVRAYYLDKFDTYLRNQTQEIRNTQEELKNNKSQLEQAREKNKVVLAEIQAEKQEQEEKRRLQEKNVSLLRRDRQQIKNKLNEVQQQKEKLNNALTSLILEEERVRKEQEERIRQLEEDRKQKLAEAQMIADDEERTREVARYSEPVSTEGFMDETLLNEVEASFAAAKGNLPWPVESGTISEHFGSRRHPVYGTITPNLGIEIVTSSQEPVRVIHDGYVVAVQPITGYGDVVVVKHGRFFTAYGNLSQIMVRKKTILSEGDIIGLSGDEDSTRGESVFFMVRENNTNVDPEDWLRKR